MRGFIVDETYRIEGGKAVVYLFGRLENGESFCTITPFTPYFCIRGEDRAKAEGHKAPLPFAIESTGWRTMLDEPVVKVVTATPKDVPVLRAFFEERKIPCFEADIRFTQRFLMDHGILRTVAINGEHEKGEFVDRIYRGPELKPAEWYPELRTLSFDIETSRDGKRLYSVSLVCRDKHRPRNEVLIVAKTRLSHARAFTDEKGLLEAFRQAVIETDPDIITGWNAIDFDLAVLREKFAQHKVPFRFGRAGWDCTLRLESGFLKESVAEVPGRQVLDGIQMLRLNFIKLDSYKLGNAAKALVGDEKTIGETGKGAAIEEAYEKRPQKLVDYNLKDSSLVLDILGKTNAVDIMLHRSLLTGMPLDRVRGSIASFDSLYLRELRRRRYVAPSGRFAEKEEGIKGGYVMDSKPGVYDNVSVCDFKSLYPSLMRTFNIDPLAYARGKVLSAISNKPHVTAPNGVVFDTSEEGILPGTLQILWEARDAAKRRGDPQASFAIKILMNSFFGVLASPTCRFFSLDLGNAITSFARETIQRTIKEIEGAGYEVLYGDSVTAERPILVRIDGKMRVLPIEELYGLFADHAVKSGGKEIIDVRSRRLETLSADPSTGIACLRPVTAIIRHKTIKEVYRVNQKHGETRCTADHSLIALERGSFTPIRPTDLCNRPLARAQRLPVIEEIAEIDLYEFLRGYTVTKTYKGRAKTARVHADESWLRFSWTNQKKPVLLRRHIRFPSAEGDALLRMLGTYVAEGSASTPETTMTRMGASIASSDFVLLGDLRQDTQLLFRNMRPCIVRSNTRGRRDITYETQSGSRTISYTDTTHKLQLMNGISAVLFKQLAGQRSDGKRVPDFIYHLPLREQELFISYAVKGDGSKAFAAAYSDEYRSRHFRYTTKSLLLVSGLSFLLSHLGFMMSIQYRPSKRAYTITTADRNNTRLSTRVIEEQYDGYVYDLSVEGTHLFADACGQVLLHNTDSVFINTKASSEKEAQQIAEKLVKDINDRYRKDIKEEYGRESHLELQAEKVFVRFLMPRVRGKESGAKKRYAGMIRKDGKLELDVTGMEIVRRDWTVLAKAFQKELLELVFEKKEPERYIKKFVEDLKGGKKDADLVYRKAARKELEGYTKTTPPHVKAARLLEKEGIPLDSNIIEYVMTNDGPYPMQLQERKPKQIDYGHYVEKQIKPIADAILSFYDASFDDIIKGAKQKTLFGY